MSASNYYLLHTVILGVIVGVPCLLLGLAAARWSWGHVDEDLSDLRRQSEALRKRRYALEVEVADLEEELAEPHPVTGRPGRGFQVGEVKEGAAEEVDDD